jgi:hypothetical protein
MPRASIVILAGHVPGTFVGIGTRELVVSNIFAGFASKQILLGIGMWMTMLIHVIPMSLGIPWSFWFLRRILIKRKTHIRNDNETDY